MEEIPKALVQLSHRILFSLNRTFDLLLGGMWERPKRKGNRFLSAHNHSQNQMLAAQDGGFAEALSCTFTVTCELA